VVRSCQNGVTEEELEAAQRYLTGAYPLRFDGNGRIAGILAGMQADGMPVDYIATRNDRVDAVTARMSGVSPRVCCSPRTCISWWSVAPRGWSLRTRGQHGSDLSESARGMLGIVACPLATPTYTPIRPRVTPVIRQLDDAAINRIAAGEVVERPPRGQGTGRKRARCRRARITVEVAHGGKTLIRVTDDGCGMGADDLPLALSRHATSKIDGTDLLNITSFGFRGEALPSLGAVGA
jgi:hypothetical protein